MYYNSEVNTVAPHTNWLNNFICMNMVRNCDMLKLSTLEQKAK